MLIYKYICDNCSYSFSTEKKKKTKCPFCGKRAKLKKIVQTDGIVRTQPVKARTVYSTALAIDPSQVAEEVRRCPDEEYVIDKKQGIARLVINGERQREKYAKRHGMVIY